jgi:uncharacterized membrane protein
MILEAPLALLALPVVLLIVVAVARAGSRTVPRRQHRWAVVARVAGVSLLVLVLAQPLLVRRVDDRSVLFLFDRSDSIGPTARSEQEAVLAAALAAARTVDRSAVAVFGAEMAVDASLAQGRTPAPILATVDGSATDLGGALRAGAALLPTEGSRRIVVLSDLVETTGDARAAARELEELGIAVDVVPLETARSADALVESVRLPAAVREGDRVPVGVVLRSTVAGRAAIEVRAGDGEPITIPVELAAGRTTVEVEVDAAGAGYLPVAVSLDASFDTRPENDRAEGITRILGAARVALVEGVAGEADELARALTAGGIAVDVMAAVPAPEALLGYDAVVLVNLARPSPEAAESLAGFVEDLGRGLVVVGGDRAYGLGDYHETPLEAVLPVSSNPDDLVRRQPVAEVLVIDSSGSMGACHCAGGQSVSAGVVKTDIAAAGAALAIDALADSDRVGVLAFSGGFDWLLPLAPKPSSAAVDEALGGLIASGDTEIAAALEEALAQLRTVPEDLRHIVLFTDGWDPNDANLLPIARKISDEGVTLSVLGTGEGPGSALRRMAELGGGRYYPGGDLESIPEIFVEETLTVARNLATEGTFLPALGAPSPVTEGLTAAPPLLGYVLTKAKGSASVSLEVGQGDPLLATWQRGLGRVSAWTSDATRRWSAGWVDWDGFVDFWGRIVRDVLPAGRESPPEVWVDGGMLRIRLERSGLDVDASAVARVRVPDGEVASVPLRRTGGSTFEGETRAASPGAYWVAVTVDDPQGGSTTSGSGAVSSYEEEFAFRSADPTLGVDLAAVTGGRLDPEPAALFDPAPVRGRAEREVWPWLVAAALALFLADAALRRLVLVEDGAAVWKESLTTTERGRERRRVERAVKARAEAPERAPEVVSDSETLQRLMRRKRR